MYHQTIRSWAGLKKDSSYVTAEKERYSSYEDQLSTCRRSTLNPFKETYISLLKDPKFTETNINRKPTVPARKPLKGQ